MLLPFEEEEGEQGGARASSQVSFDAKALAW